MSRQEQKNNTSQTKSLSLPVPEGQIPIKNELPIILEYEGKTEK